MGKRRAWRTTLRRWLTGRSKVNTSNQARHEKKGLLESKKWGIGRFKNIDVSSRFFFSFRKPSSVEKILGDAEAELQLANTFSPKIFRQTSASLPCVTARPLFQNHFLIAAIKIQSSYRGYMARKRYRAVKALLRIQTHLWSQGVKRQTLNTMRYTQMLSRIQLQIRSRRIQMTAGDSSWHDTSGTYEDFAGRLDERSSNHQTGVERQKMWDDSVLPKEELEARLHRKVESKIKRERALAYAYSSKLSKSTPNSSYSFRAVAELQRDFPWHFWIHHDLTDPEYNPILPPPPSKERIISIQVKRSGQAVKMSQSNGVVRDAESLRSCPDLTTSSRAHLSYMAPTASIEAKRSFSFRWRKGKLSTEAEKGNCGAMELIRSSSALSDSAALVPVRGTGSKSNDRFARYLPLGSFWRV